MEGSTVEEGSAETTIENQVNDNTDQKTNPVESGATDQHEEPVLHIEGEQIAPIVEPVNSVTNDVYITYVQLPSMTLRVENTITSGDLLTCTLLAFMIIVFMIVSLHRLVFGKGGR